MLGVVKIILFLIDDEYYAIFAVVRMVHFHTREGGPIDG